MKQDTLITIGTLDGGHLDENGVWVEGFRPLLSTHCIVQPYSQELAVKKYGIDVVVNKRIFIDHIDNRIKVGMYINDETFQIKAIPWDYKHMEIIAYKKVSTIEG